MGRLETRPMFQLLIQNYGQLLFHLQIVDWQNEYFEEQQPLMEINVIATITLSVKVNNDNTSFWKPWNDWCN